MRRGGLSASLPVLAALAGLGACGAAHAHGGDPRVRAELGSLPPELAGMRVELHDTIAPQVVLANRTARTVEVLDDEGVAFLRIGPRGVEGNVAARAWYQTLGPGSPVPKAARQPGAPRWVRARAEPAWGWFDPRLDAQGEHQAHGAQRGTWTIPLRVDGARVPLSGAVRRAETPAGAYVARLTSPAEVAPGVRVRVLPGRHPGLLLTNDGELPVTVLDGDGAPFLRIGPAGVEADVETPRGSAAVAPAPPRATRRAAGRRGGGSPAPGAMAGSTRASRAEPPRAPSRSRGRCRSRSARSASSSRAS